MSPPNELTCPPDCELLPPGEGESLPPEVLAHVEACPNCRQRQQRLHQEVNDLRQFVRGVPAVTGSWSPAISRTTLTETPDALSDDESSENPAGRNRASAGPARRSVLNSQLTAPQVQEPRPMTIGKYVVVCALDAGGQADVYRAVHPTLGKEFVIKLSRKPQPSDHAERDRLVAEGKILAELDHPNLARIHDLDFHNGHAFLAEVEQPRERFSDFWVPGRESG